MTQCDAILKHLKQYGSITAIEALNMYGCFRLAARINDLRGDGHQIITVPVTNGDKRYAKYWLGDGKRQKA